MKESEEVKEKRIEERETKRESGEKFREKRKTN
jgi:hypothetical protein